MTVRISKSVQPEHRPGTGGLCEGIHLALALVKKASGQNSFLSSSNVKGTFFPDVRST